jgi:fucose permease
MWASCFGVGTGAAITSINLFTGRNYPERRAAMLTMLNFTWSLGALLAPLVAARLLAIGSWRTVYLALAGAAALAALVVGTTIRDRDEVARDTAETEGLRNLRLVALFAVFFFLEVGMESTFGAWISTYVLRATHATVALAAAAAAIYWGGFLAARGLSPLVLLRIRPGRLLVWALLTALGAATLLVAAGSPLVLGAATRFILAFCGLGGAVLPWLVGAISARTGSLRMGLIAGPVTLLAMIALLPVLRVRESRG